MIMDASIKTTIPEKKAITNVIMYKEIMAYLNNKYPEFTEACNILEYDSVADGRDSQEVYVDNCQVKAEISTGGNEGIYISYFIEYPYEKEYINGYERTKIIRLATLKSLDEHMDGYMLMGKIAGALTLAGNLYLNVNDSRLERRNK